MSRVPPWFERKFDFTFPAERFPSLLARLREAPARLDDAVRDVPSHVLIRKPRGKWSAQEHAGHLLDLESLWAARAEDFLSGRLELTPADLTNRKTTEAGHNLRPLEEILAAFRRARQHLLTRVGEFEAEALGRTMLHPRLKQPMRLVDHLYFAAEHDDHHLAIIQELVNA